MMRLTGTIGMLCAAAVLGTAPAEAKKRKPEPAPVPVRPAPILALPSSANAAAVNYFYERRGEAPIWFSAAGGAQAIADLLGRLRTAS